MQTSWITVAPIALTAIVAAASACSGPTDVPPGNGNTGGASGLTGGTTSTGGSGPGATGGSGPGSTGGTTFTTGGSDTTGTGGSGNTSTTGGTGPSTGGTGPSTGGTGPSTGGTGPSTGGTGPSTGGTGPSTGGTAPSTGGTSVGGGAAGGPYAPRTGSFKMLIYSRNVTGGFHHDSIPAGQKMLQDIGVKQGFETTINPDNDNEITAAGLAKYEIVFFMNSTGEIFDATARKTYEDWIKNNGAYGGVHSATDTANGWAFYKEMTGQYYDLHNPCCASSDITWTADGQAFVAVKGLPSPWTRAEEWYKFNKWQDWSTKAGFKILGTVNTNDGGTRPVSYIREWGNFRSFYTSLGHETKAFQDANVIKHVTAGIMWAVRREALIKP